MEYYIQPTQANYNSKALRQLKKNYLPTSSSLLHDHKDYRFDDVQCVSRGVDYKKNACKYAADNNPPLNTKIMGGLM